MSDEEDPSCAQKVWAQRTSKHAQTLLKCLSIIAGLFLLVAGTVGLSAIIFFQLVYFIGSFYTIFFGLLVLTVELRDKVPFFAAAFQWIDFYLKFLTLQRGKGAFYWGVGLLVLFIGPDGSSKWGLNNVAALFLALVGFLHTFKIIGESSAALGPGEANPFEEHAPGSTMQSALPDSDNARWTDLVTQNK
uniref:Uncharacterized protein n=1 Tax=Coccolithus braarudii TaxID=221442 RepID=A0A7S0LKQ8_9EUKA|mmetsp:Transcript_45899/g.97905  ORF Transcript_45899/g.97905 Transcript_45899/m.97905 type:complete len:190 (+) Transcript_45899:109-678(+)|eukprot:CAMPEP_0183333448 /NCGR_PEP_ID=MMETSP0164_2-20130417/2339_1 /TAXON_ID=221442 /ORGANISM="Coccolithus pelagicus ssp braarudi, Strain PLY182g" /LENGTH=189 /DNA_ID=CAMNT_0025502369 /DNA_START=109 /DNA_END=678 /DNA_ORIENTATION=+